MHRCLRIDEVVQWIADSAVHLWLVEKGTLLCMALTCRSFFSPAMNVLWCSSDVKRLINLLPRGSFAETVTNGQYVEMKLLSRPTPADWSRFSMYARRVQYLDGDYRINGLAVHWCSVLDYFPGSQPFPRLRSLHWSRISECECAHSGLLLSPHLRGFTARGLEMRDVEHVTDDLLAWTPPLKQLTIATSFRGEKELRVAENLWQALAELRWLEVLDLSLYAPRAFHHLVSLSSLTSLRLTIDRVDLQDAELRFYALKSLAFGMEMEIEAAARLLRRMSLPALERFFIGYRNRHITAAGVRSTLQEVSKIPSLRSVEFIKRSGVRSGPTEDLDGSALAPLYALHALETLNLEQLAVGLSDADIEPIARAWPRIETLRLYERWPLFGTTPPPPLPLDAILTFVQLCPRLRTLGLPFRLNHMRGTPADADLPVCAGLEQVGVWEVRAPLSVPAVRFLARVFPRAKIRGYTRGDRSFKVMCEMKAAFVEEIYGAQFADKHAY